MNDRWVTRATSFGLLGGLLAMICRSTVLDLDLFHELALFRETLATGWLPARDPFAYTPTVDLVVHHEWGTGAVIYLATVATGFGAAGLVALKYLVCGLLVAGCVWCARLRGAREVSIALLAPIAIALGSLGVTTIRAQLFTLGLLTLQLLLFEQDRKGGRWWLAVWLPVYVLWLNLHAGFVVGCGLYGLYSLERLARELAESRSLATSLRRNRTPDRRRTGDDPVGHGQSVRMGVRALPLACHPHEKTPGGRMALALAKRPIGPLGVVLLLDGGRAIHTRGKGLSSRAGTAHGPGRRLVGLPAYPAFVDLRRGLVLLRARLFAGYPTLPGGRESPLGTCRALGRILDALRNRGPFLRNLSSVLELRIPVSLAEVEEEVPIYPAGAVDYLAQNRFAGNVLLPYNSGAFVSWKLFPAVKVSIDSRYEVAYPPGAVEEIVAFFNAHDGWRETLARYATDAILVPTWCPIHESLDELQPSQDHPSFRRTYRDDAYSLFVRQGVGQDLPTVDRTGEKIVGHYP